MKLRIGIIKNMKNVLWAIIVLMAGIGITELGYIGETSLAWVILVMASSIAILAFNQAQNIK